jgi:hypothetical protein
MAIFNINTNIVRRNGSTAFSSDSAGADTLIVRAGASLESRYESSGTHGVAAVLANTGAWTVTIDGLIFGELRLSEGNPDVSNIRIGATGRGDG